LRRWQAAVALCACGPQPAYQIGVKYDDGSWATIRQAAPTGLRVGDRVRVTDYGVELLR